jgi:hypothetical protein
MKRKLKSALRHHFNHQGEQGFVLPIAIGLGLAMILVGTTMVIRSQGDQVTASAQQATSRGQSAAETGISRYQALINNNRAIAVYSRTGTPSWTNAAAIPGINTVCNGGSASAVTAASTTAWQDVDANDSTKGQYRLIDYIYAGVAGQAPGTGTLTVEGRVNQSGIGSTATARMGTATTRLQVNIPVRQGNLNNVPFPGMWVKNSVSTGNTAANVMAPCSGTPTINLASGYQLTRSDLPMPSIPARSTTYINALGVTVTIPDLSTFQRINDPTGMTLPRPTDLPTRTSTGETVYEYSVGQITGSFNITPGQKVAIYLDGNIDMTGGQEAIQHQCGSTPNCSATDARIYGLSQNGQLNLGGNAAICDIMFLAPNYDVSLNGGGQAQGCGGGANNNGVYWVRSWDGGGQGNHTSIHQSSTNPTWNNVSFLTTLTPPRIESFSLWQRQRAQ